jgi:N utilization substance protein B
MSEQEKLFFENFELDGQKLSKKDAKYISEKSNKIIEKIEEIDGMINKQTKGWTTSRMGKVDLAILRLAVYEIVFDEDVPTGVAINEAVEIAKKFGQEESSGFVNGILAKFAN